jgi:hypothetical protein
MARALSYDPAQPMAASTVQKWKKGGYVPPPQWERIVDAADAAGVVLEPADFLGSLLERLDRHRSASRPARELEPAA